MWEAELMGRLRRIRRRLRVLSFYRMFLTWAFWCAVGALGFAGVSRLAPTGAVTLWHVIGALGGLCLLVAGLWSAFRPLSLFQAAVYADVRLGLRERLSTALVYLRDRREIAEEVKRDALDASCGIEPRRDFRPVVRPYTKYFWLPVGAAVLVWQFVPHFDVVARRAPDAGVAGSQAVAKDLVVQELDKIQKRLENAAVEKKSAGEQLEELSRDIDRLVQQMQQQPTLKPQETMAKISTIEERLEEQRKALQDKLDASRLTRPLLKTGEVRQMAEALKRGDMEAASEALEQAMDKIQRGEMSPQDMKRLAGQLEQLAQEIQDSGELSEQMKELARQLSQASGNGKGGRLSAEDLKTLSTTSGQLAREMLDLKEAVEQLRRMAELESRLGRCKSACRGTGRIDMTAFGNDYKRDKIRAGMVGAGIGAGNPAPVAETDVKFQEDKVEGQRGEGEIIASMKVPQMGEGAVGRSRLKPQDVSAEYRREAEAAMDREVIPASHREVVRRYYEQLVPPAGAESAGSAPAPPVETK
ncbi:MAG: hypothetical protein Kow0059_15310 [Candidatus Sumerlaeia bacterium]